jgi:Ataxin-3
MGRQAVPGHVHTTSRTRRQVYYCSLRAALYPSSPHACYPGYSVFAVVQKDPSSPLGLPRTEADHIACIVPESSVPSRTRDTGSSSHAAIEGFEDEDMELQAALQASLAGSAAHSGADQPYYPAPVSAASRDPIFGSGSRTPVERRGYGVLAQARNNSEGEDEDEEVGQGLGSSTNRYASLPADVDDPIAASRARSQAYMEQVRRQQEAALRDSYQEEVARMEAGVGRRRNTRAEQEEAELLAAIEESRAMHETLGDATPPTRDEDEDEQPQPATFGADRVYDDEDAELQAALKASLESLPEGFRIPTTPPAVQPARLPLPTSSHLPPTAPEQREEDNDDVETESEADSSIVMDQAPQVSMEELRKKRLERFGG